VSSTLLERIRATFADAPGALQRLRTCTGQRVAKAAYMRPDPNSRISSFRLSREMVNHTHEVIEEAMDVLAAAVELDTE
jgi:hypothetical protein